MSEAKTRSLSWSEIADACAELQSQFVNQFRIVIPVSRGGLVPAAFLAYALKLPVTNLVVPAHGAGLWERRDLLVVDDICDTGKTFRKLRISFPNATLVAPFVKPAGKPDCNHWAVELPQDVWAIFPWAPHDTASD